MVQMYGLKKGINLINFADLFKLINATDQNNNKKLMQNHQENYSLDVNQSQCDSANEIPNQNQTNQKKMFIRRYWTNQEQISYYYHIKENYVQFQHPTNKRVTKVFKALSQKMKTRSPDQIRSHHQKMMKKYRNLNKLVIELQKKFKNKTEVKEIKKQSKQNIQKKRNLFNSQTITPADMKTVNILLTENKQDDILQITLREDLSNYYDCMQNNFMQESHQEHIQIFTFNDQFCFVQ